MKIDTLFDKAAEHNVAIDAEETRLRTVIERAEEGLKKLARIRPIDTARAIAHEVGVRMTAHQVVVLGPFGMTGDMGLHVENDAGEIVASLTLEPNKERKGGLMIVEGLGREAKRTPLSGTIDDLVERLKAQTR